MRRRWTIRGAALLAVVLLSIGCALVARDDSSIDDGANKPVAEQSSTGTMIITVQTRPEGQEGTFAFTGVPTGTLTAGGDLIVSNLEPGTYSSTEVDPAPDFDVTAIRCDDRESAIPSSGDAQTRTAVMNLDPGETVRCTFVNTQRGSAVVVSATDPEGAGGSFLFTGVPTGTLPGDGTLTVANLQPGTYSTTEADPAPDFDLVEVSCDDGASPNPSSGDPQTRSAIFNIEPGEMVVCTFTNARRGTIVVAPEIVSEGATATFQYTGVPTGTVPGGGTLVAANLEAGTYTTTEVDPAPDFELTEVTCDDATSRTASTGDAQTHTAVVNLDPGETVTCVFSHGTEEESGPDGGGSVSPTGDDEEGSETPSSDGVNPFENPDRYLADFPLPDALPPDTGSATVPKAGPWTVVNLAGQISCNEVSRAISAAPPEAGVIEVLDGGQTLVGTSLQEDQTAPLEMTAEPGIDGRYAGAIGGMEQGVPISIDYVWQVVTEEYIVGYLTSTFASQGVSCTIYRPYELTYSG